MALVPLAIANGAVREIVLKAHLGLRTAEPISGILLMLAIAAVTWLVVGRLAARCTRTWLGIGAGWLLATLLFEFGVGLVNGRNWPELLAPYRFADCNLWPIAVLWIACAPLAIARIRQGSS